MLEVGTKAPAFELPDENGTVHTLEEYKGQKVILYFYPRDNTSGCTAQACAFGDLMPAFREKGAVIVGVSKDTVASHKKFKEKYELPSHFLRTRSSKPSKHMTSGTKRTCTARSPLASCAPRTSSTRTASS